MISAMSGSSPILYLFNFFKIISLTSWFDYFILKPNISQIEIYMSNRNFEKVLILEKKRQELIEELFSIKEMVQGSFCLIHVKCGNDYCRCNHGQLHPHYRMSMRRDGKQLSRAVPKEEHTWITRVTNNYRQYREIVRAIKVVEKKIVNLIEKHGIELVRKSSKNKPYLSIVKGKSETKLEKSSENVTKKTKKK
jgi:hypothetical protein